jgi:DNA-binding NarL/FixJ family response regulator
MGLTDRERSILELANQGLSDYKIARKLNINPPTVSRLHKNAQRKLADALADIQWATKTGLDFTEFEGVSEG